MQVQGNLHRAASGTEIAEVPGARPLVARIDLSAVESNARAIKGLVGPDCQVMAVVKANGYGLGASWVARAALDGGATRLGVACVDEGVALRRDGITCPILVMSYAAPEEMAAAVRHNLTVVVHRTATASALEAAASAQGKSPGSVNVHIKVDTGLGRFGCSPPELLPLADFVRRHPHLRLEGLMTHFAAADSPDIEYSKEQLRTFNRLREDANRQGFHFDIYHAANSAGTLALPEARLDMVRTGILLSGHYPAPHLSNKLALQPAVSIKTVLARVFSVQKGQSVGYGRTWTAQRDSRIGLIPIGYADGYARLFSNRAWVLVNGVRCPVVGRVSMDQSAVDITDVAAAREGDEAVVAGTQGSDEISVDELAAWAETISYEIMCGLAARVRKLYVRDGQTVAECNLLGCVESE